MISILSRALLLAGLAVACQAASELFCKYLSDDGNEISVDLHQTHFDDCEDALNKGFTKSGVYRIKPQASLRPFKVWCDMESEGGGWTLIQTRFDGLIEFNRTWIEYRNGFGSVDSEHWLGNNFIREITVNNDYELKIELTGYLNNEFAFAKYSPFRIGSEDEKYKLYVGQFTRDSTTTPDSLSIHQGQMFSTKDNDNDQHAPGNCAEAYKGGWWYTACYSSNLNGVFMTEKTAAELKGLQTPLNAIGIIYRGLFNSQFYSLKSVEMKVSIRSYQS